MHPGVDSPADLPSSLTSRTARSSAGVSERVVTVNPFGARPGETPATVSRFTPRRSLAVAALFCGGLSDAAAQPDDITALFAPGTVYSVGMLTGAGPRFAGGRRASLWALPYFSFRRADETPDWWSPDDALDASLVEAGPVQIGPVLDFRSGRSASDTHGLPGLPTLPLAVGLGLFGDVWAVKDTIRLRAEVTQGVRAHDGILVKLAGDLVGRFGRYTLSAGPRLVLADTASMRLDFAVPADARLGARGLPAFAAKGGLRAAGGAAALSYAWSDAWQTLAYLRYDRLVADAARSPIVRRIGSVDQISFGIGALYAFRASP